MFDSVPMPSPARPTAFLTFLLLLMAGAAALRCYPPVLRVGPDGIDFLDADTVRRLVRLNQLDAAEHYPAVDVRDGFPAGTDIQWTLPMDAVIRAIDAVAPPLSANARRYETGAALAGPVIGTLAVLAFALLARRLFAPLPAALAAWLYALSAPAIEVTRLGNGDHQSLQDLCAVLALLGCLALVAGRGARGLAALGGASLGLALWVNAESMLLLGAAGGIVWLGLAVSPQPEVRRRLPPLRVYAGVAAAVTACGQLIENGGALTLAWDRVSCFQTAAAMALCAFVWLAMRGERRGARPAVALTRAAAIAGAAVAAPFLLVPPLRHALQEQLAAARSLAAFASACVAEYKTLFADDSWQLVFGPTLFLVPVCLAALPWAQALAPAARAGIAVPSVLLGALVVDQIKLSHLFAIPWALLLTAGGAAAVDLVAAALRLRAELRPRVRIGAALTLAGHATWHILSLTFTPAGNADADGDRRALVAAVKDLAFVPANAAAAERVAVMAPWDLGHYLLYDTDKPIVASSYQRRVDGIVDSYEVLCAPTPDEARAILARRRVRWFVRPGDPSFLLQYHRLVPGRPELGRSEPAPGGPRIRLDPAVRQAFWARTAPGTALPPWLELVYETPGTRSWWGSFPGPAFRVFRVRYADESG